MKVFLMSLILGVSTTSTQAIATEQYQEQNQEQYIEYYQLKPIHLPRDPARSVEALELKLDPLYGEKGGIQSGTYQLPLRRLFVHCGNSSKGFPEISAYPEMYHPDGRMVHAFIEKFEWSEVSCADLPKTIRTISDRSNDPGIVVKLNYAKGTMKLIFQK